jgi:DNA gyrase subunit A
VIGIILGPNDELVSVSLTDGVQDVVLATNLGKAIRFSEREIRPMGRVSRGVKCIRLGKGSEVIGMEMVEEGTSLLTITAGGFGKRTRFSMYRSQGRGGSGVINIKMRKDRGEVVAIKKVRDEDEVIMATESGMIIRYRCRDIAETGRGTQGVKLISLSEDDKLIDCAICVKED